MDQCAGMSSDATVEKLLLAHIPASIQTVDYVKLIQQLLIFELSFLDGASVLESTHRCIFLWEKCWSPTSEPKSIREKLELDVFITYCKVLNRSLYHLNSYVLTSEIYEGILVANDVSTPIS